DEKTLEPVSYYSKFPPDIANTEVLLIDPMLATGGSGSAAIAFLKRAGVTSMKFVCLVAAPEGIEAVHRMQPDLPLYCHPTDRALGLSLLSRRLTRPQRRKAVTYGWAGPFVFRFVPILMTTWLLHTRMIKFLGGAYLLYLAGKYLVGGDGKSKDPQPGAAAP